MRHPWMEAILVEYNSLVKCFRSIKAVKSIEAILIRSSISFNISRFNAVIRVFCDLSHFDDCFSLYRHLRFQGIRPDFFTFPFVIKSCGHFKSIFGAQVHRDVVVFGWQSDVFIADALIDMYGKYCQPNAARKVFDEMPARTIVSWSSLIGVYTRNGCSHLGLWLFSCMVGEGLNPNRASILNTMTCVANDRQGNQVWGIAVGCGLGLDRSVQNAALQMYARCGKIELARKCFGQIVSKDAVAWTSMIDAYVKASLPWDALDVFKEMRLQVAHVDSVTILGVIGALSSLSCFKGAKTVHGFITRMFLRNENSLETAMVDLYVKCGSLSYARRLFDEIPKKNIISWNSMIDGYGKHGCGREALFLFDRMKNFLKPDGVMFVSILSACSHGGLIVEGLECFASMTRDFDILPGPDHYACVVDLLARAGRLDEAREFIDKMSVEGEVGVWGAILGACKIHLNGELAGLAGKSLIRMDGNNSGRYVLLSNIHESLGNRKGAKYIRDLMKCRGVKKNVGCANV